jgi:hypothetical protein
MNYVRNHGYTYFVAKSIKDIEQNLGIWPKCLIVWIVFINFIKVYNIYK